MRAAPGQFRNAAQPTWSFIAWRRNRDRRRGKRNREFRPLRPHRADIPPCDSLSRGHALSLSPIRKLRVTYSIFNRDHPGTAEDRVIGAFADAILKLDNCRPALMQAKPRP